MPKMPGGDDGEKKEESAESREEAKEQVAVEKDTYFPKLILYLCFSCLLPTVV